MTKTAALLVAAAGLAGSTALAQGYVVPSPAGPPKLPSQVKIDPSVVKSLKVPPALITMAEFDAAVAAVKTEAEGVKAARKTLEDAERACASRTYSSQDMRDAGCADTDTVGACTAKLYRLCMRAASRRYRGHLVSFNRAVEALDQKARGLAIPPEAP